MNEETALLIETPPPPAEQAAQTTPHQGDPEPDPASYDLLTAAGVTPSVARKLALTCDPVDVAGWVNYARSAKGIQDPAALVVARLKAGELPPKAEKAEDDSQRYITGKYADYIQH